MTYASRRLWSKQSINWPSSKVFNFVEGFKKVKMKWILINMNIQDVAYMVLSELHVKQINKLHNNPKESIALFIAAQETSDPIGPLC